MGDNDSPSSDLDQITRFDQSQSLMAHGVAPADLVSEQSMGTMFLLNHKSAMVTSLLTLPHESFSQPANGGPLPQLTLSTGHVLLPLNGDGRAGHKFTILWRGYEYILKQ